MNVQHPHDMSAVLYPGEEQLSQLLIDGVEDYAIFLLDPYGEILTWNTGAARLMGYTRDEAIGEHFSMFIPPTIARQGSRRNCSRPQANKDMQRTKAGTCARTPRASGQTHR